MEEETLAGTAGALPPLLLAYTPGLSGWYARLGEGLPEEEGGVRKRLVMLGALLVVALGCYGLACSGAGADFGVGLTCDRSGLAGLLQALMLALAANQATYLIGVRGTKTSEAAHEAQSSAA